MKSNYSTAHGILGFLEFLAWAGVVLTVIGVIATTSGGAGRGNGMAIAGTLVVAASAIFGCLITVALAHIGRAILNMAENSYHSGQLLASIDATLRKSSIATPDAPPPPTPSLAKQTSWRDGQITLSRYGAYIARDRQFPTLAEAEAYLDMRG